MKRFPGAEYDSRLRAPLSALESRERICDGRRFSFRKAFSKIAQRAKSRSGSAKSVCSIHEETPFPETLRAIAGESQSRVPQNSNGIAFPGTFGISPNSKGNLKWASAKGSTRVFGFCELGFGKKEGQSRKGRFAKGKCVSQVELQIGNAGRDYANGIFMSASRVRSMNNLNAKTRRLRKRAIFKGENRRFAHKSRAEAFYSRALRKVACLQKTIQKLLLKNNCGQFFRRKLERGFTFKMDPKAEKTKCKLSVAQSKGPFPAFLRKTRKHLEAPFVSGPKFLGEPRKAEPFPETRGNRKTGKKEFSLKFQLSFGNFDSQKAFESRKSSQKELFQLNASLHLFNSKD